MIIIVIKIVIVKIGMRCYTGTVQRQRGAGNGQRRGD
jgi:hypothetical protein